jgi:hypothetical protein
MVRNSPYCPSLPSAPGRIRKTNGSRRPSGIASRSFALASPNTSSRPPRRVRTSSLKAALSAQPTISRTAKARKPRPKKWSRGPSAPMSSASWIGRRLNQKRPAHSPAKRRLPTRRRSENGLATGLRFCPEPFFCGTVGGLVVAHQSRHVNCRLSTIVDNFRNSTRTQAFLPTFAIAVISVPRTAVRTSVGLSPSTVTFVISCACDRRRS